MIDTWVFILLFCLYLYMFKIFHNKKLFKKGNKISYWHLCGMNKLQFTENNTSSHTAEFPWQSSASSTRGTGSIPGRGSKILHVPWHRQKKFWLPPTLASPWAKSSLLMMPASQGGSDRQEVLRCVLSLLPSDLTLIMRVGDHCCHSFAD